MVDAPNLSDGPLRGVRVLDLARVIAGPYLSRILTDLGADVIKLEPPEGDESRVIAPRHDRGMSALFTFANAGKRSISVDLRKPDGLAIALDLVARSDLVVENFRPGVAERLGLAWSAIHARNPRAVLVRLNGYGSDSALAERRAYAPVMHAATGLLHAQSEFARQPVAQRRESHADTVTSLHGAVAALAALRVAESTGVGQQVEVPMFDAVLSTNDSALHALLDPPDDRSMNPIFDAGPHGAIAVAGAVQHVWRLLSTGADLADPTPPGADLPEKARRRHGAIEEWMCRQPSREALLDALEAAGLACSPVVPLRDAMLSPIARERGLLVPVDDRRGGTRPVVRPPARLSGSRNEVRGRAPLQGEHNREVLDGLGYAPERIAELEAAGVLVRPPQEGSEA